MIPEGRRSAQHRIRQQAKMHQVDGKMRKAKQQAHQHNTQPGRSTFAVTAFQQRIAQRPLQQATEQSFFRHTSHQ